MANYRLGLLGFLGGKAIKGKDGSTGNWGIQVLCNPWLGRDYYYIRLLLLYTAVITINGNGEHTRTHTHTHACNPPSLAQPNPTLTNPHPVCACVCVDAMGVSQDQRMALKWVRRNIEAFVQPITVHCLTPTPLQCTV